MHLFLSAEGSQDHLLRELERLAPEGRHGVVSLQRHARGGEDETRSSGLVRSDQELPSDAPLTLAFARQGLLDAVEATQDSISAWAELLFASVVERVPEDQPWLLHLVPHYGAEGAGANRCRLIVEGLRDRLRRRRRALLKRWQADGSTFTPDTSLVQLLLTDPEHGWLAVSIAPMPHRFRAVISPFPGGEIPIASDKAAPCRAFAKLVEALARLGNGIRPGQTCVDLGASPGSWSYVALRRGAQVVAVDRAPLRADLMRDPNLKFQRGDAFSFEPDRPVDWLLCDVIAAPQRSIDLVLRWAGQRWARWFVVTIKFKGSDDYPALDRLKKELAPLCRDFRLTRLCANRNEACVFGELAAALGVAAPSNA